MNGYLFTYESPGNLDRGSVVILADSLMNAQDSFFDWLKKQPLYSHMWRLVMHCHRVEVVE